MNNPLGSASPRQLKEDDSVTLKEPDEERAADLVNYEGLEESEEAAAEIAKHATAGRRRVYDSLDKVKEFLGADPVVSKLGLIVKTKAGIAKRRLIQNAKESTVSLATAREERTVNPEVLDAVNHARRYWQPTKTSQLRAADNGPTSVWIGRSLISPTHSG